MSGLGDAVSDYLAMRRALGFRLAGAGRLLQQFAPPLVISPETCDDLLSALESALAAAAEELLPHTQRSRAAGQR